MKNPYANTKHGYVVGLRRNLRRCIAQISSRIIHWHIIFLSNENLEKFLFFFFGFNQSEDNRERKKKKIIVN